MDSFVILPAYAYEKMIAFRDRNARVALFDGIEEGGIRASSSYSSHEIDEQENDRAMEGLQDRVIMLKRVSLYLQKHACTVYGCFSQPIS